MKRIFAIIPFAFLFFAPALTLADPPHYRVAVIVALTGDGAAWGIPTKEGVDIALSELSPELRARLDVFYEDDALQGKNSVSAFRRLSSEAHIDAAINVSSGTGNALAPITENAGTVLFAIASDKRIAENRPHTFIFYLNPEDEVRAATNEMKRRGYKNIALITAIQEGYLAGEEALDKLEPKPIQIAFREQFPPEVRDFRSSITKMKALTTPVDAVYILLMPGQVGIFARQARDLGLTVPLVGGINFENKEEIESAHGALDGQWYVTNGDPTPEFLRKYRARNPDAPLASATNGHDAMALIAKALREGIEPGQLAEFLSTVKKFDGASGAITMGSERRFSFPASVKVVGRAGE